MAAIDSFLDAIHDELGPGYGDAIVGELKARYAALATVREVAQEMFNVWFLYPETRISDFAPQLGEALRGSVWPEDDEEHGDES